MKILHTSDMHGEVIKRLHNKTHIRSKFDVWLDTGDFFPNDPIITMLDGHFDKHGRFNRNWVRKIDRKHEILFQKDWLKRLNVLDKMVEWLDGRPFVSVGGNHDFISLAKELNDFGYQHAYEIDPEGFELLGFKWAGFPNINYMIGEWNHESHPAEFSDLLERISNSDPDILVTHSPPQGILDIGGYYEHHIGVGQISIHLSYKPNKVKYHFFGHVHEKGGKKVVELDKTFFNGATHAIIHEI